MLPVLSCILDEEFTPLFLVVPGEERPLLLFPSSRVLVPVISLPKELLEVLVELPLEFLTLFLGVEPEDLLILVPAVTPDCRLLFLRDEWDESPAELRSPET